METDGPGRKAAGDTERIVLVLFLPSPEFNNCQILSAGMGDKGRTGNRPAFKEIDLLKLAQMQPSVEAGGGFEHSEF